MERWLKGSAILVLVLLLVGTLAGSGCAEDDKDDENPPIISEVSASDITETSAVITWTTDEPATTQVEYGLTTGYGSTSILDDTLVKNHSVSLSNLAIATTYHYRVKSVDAMGNEKVSGDYILTTLENGDGNGNGTDKTPPVISDIAVIHITVTCPPRNDLPP